MYILPVNNYNAQTAVINRKKNELHSQPNEIQFRGGTKIADLVENRVSNNMERLNRIATTYLDVLESVAAKLKDKGIIFDRAYCEQNPVKSPKSYTSKIVRSGSFKVPDAIRATLYITNPYDLSVLNDELLPELKKRGYVISDTEMTVKDLKKRGYIPEPNESDDKEKIIPDLDIRLADVVEQISKLNPEYRYAISKPQKSGYEDIQMRLVRSFEKRKHPLQHELLILFGPNYAEAKHLESEKVYGILRKFDELNVKVKANEENPDAKLIYRYIDLIEKMMRGKISQKLYENAKNKDMFNIEEQIPITFLKTDLAQFEHYFKVLKSKISSYYRSEKLANQNNPEMLKQLSREQRADQARVNIIYDKLSETLAYFSKKQKEKPQT